MSKKFYRLGLLFVVLGLAFTGVLETRMHLTGLVVVSITFALGLMNWLWARAHLS